MQGSGLVVNVSIVAKGVGQQSHKRTPSRQQTIARLLQQTRNNLCELTTCDYATISQYIPSHIAIADIVVGLNNIIDDDITSNEQSEWLSQAKDEMSADITIIWSNKADKAECSPIPLSATTLRKVMKTLTGKAVQIPNTSDAKKAAITAAAATATTDQLATRLAHLAWTSSCEPNASEAD
eukprot:scaffold64048_cov52-Attheya_sp.AAC.1